MNDASMHERPWYRNRWVWLVIAIPAIGMIMSAITVTMAVMGADADVRNETFAPLDKSSWRLPQAPRP